MSFYYFIQWSLLLLLLLLLCTIKFSFSFSLCCVGWPKHLKPEMVKRKRERTFDGHVREFYGVLKIKGKKYSCEQRILLCCNIYSFILLFLFTTLLLGMWINFDLPHIHRQHAGDLSALFCIHFGESAACVLHIGQFLLVFVHI
jgi:hypothetical protein